MGVGDTTQEGSMRPTREDAEAAQRSTGTEEDRTGEEEVDEVEGRAATTQAATPQKEEGEEREQPTATTQQSIAGERGNLEAPKVPRPAQAVNRPKRKNRGQPVYFAREKKRQATTQDGRRKRGMVRIRYVDNGSGKGRVALEQTVACLLYTSPSPRDQRGSRMPSSA